MPSYSGLYDTVHQVSYSPLGGQNLRRSLQRRLMKTVDGRKFIAQAKALVAKNVGAENVVITNTQIVSRRQDHNPNAGIVPVVTQTIRNSPSTTVDRDDLNIALSPVKPFAFARDRSGNGGVDLGNRR